MLFFGNAICDALHWRGQGFFMRVGGGGLIPGALATVRLGTSRHCRQNLKCKTRLNTFHIIHDRYSTAQNKLYKIFRHSL